MIKNKNRSLKANIIKLINNLKKSKNKYIDNSYPINKGELRNMGLLWYPPSFVIAYCEIRLEALDYLTKKNPKRAHNLNWAHSFNQIDYYTLKHVDTPHGIETRIYPHYQIHSRYVKGVIKNKNLKKDYKKKISYASHHNYIFQYPQDIKVITANTILANRACN